MFNVFISSKGEELLIYQGETLYDVAPTGITSTECLEELRSLAKHFPRNDWRLVYATERGELELAKIADTFS